MKRTPTRPIRPTPAARSTHATRALAIAERDSALRKAMALAALTAIGIAAAALAAAVSAQPSSPAASVNAQPAAPVSAEPDARVSAQPAAPVSAEHAPASAEHAAPDSGPGWTGSTHPDDVIAARRALMLELQTLMIPIDSHAAGEPAEPDELRAAARTIAAMLATVPHLFPPTTDRYDENAETPVTLALPAVWQDFPGFYSLASAAATAATKLMETSAPAELPAASRALRGACDACHAVYMREYAAPEVSSEDLEFDFDSLFEPPLE